MKRKKKKEEKPTVYNAPFGSIALSPLQEPDLSPYTIDITGIGDTTKRFMTSTYSGGYSGVSDGPYYIDGPTIFSGGYTSSHLSAESSEQKDDCVFKVTYMEDNNPAVTCSDIKWLSEHKILKTIEMMKHKLIAECKTMEIDHIECNTTKINYNTIRTACKKLKMYGKEKPIIASFDEFGNRLPDIIKPLTGMTINIIEDQTDIKMTLKAILTGKIKIDTTTQYLDAYTDILADRKWKELIEHSEPIFVEDSAVFDSEEEPELTKHLHKKI